MSWRPPNGGYWGDDVAEIFNQANPRQIDPGPEFDRAEEDHGRELFYKGWIDSSLSPDERSEARETFMDWMWEWGMESDDFPWDEWREWYGEAA